MVQGANLYGSECAGSPVQPLSCKEEPPRSVFKVVAWWPSLLYVDTCSIES